MAKQQCVTLYPEVEKVTRKLSDQQFGILIRAVIAYRFRGEVYDGEDDRVDMAFSFMADQVDRMEELKEKKSAAANARWSKQTEQETDAICTSMQTDAEDAPILSHPVLSDPVLSHPVQAVPENKETKISKDKKVGNGAAAPTRDRQRSFGKFGWVKLSQREYDALAAELGQTELQRCIDYLDEAAQITGNKNKWRDFGLVIRKCSREQWGLDGRGRKDVPMGAGGLGEAELWNIRRAMEDNYAAAPGN